MESFKYEDIMDKKYNCIISKKLTISLTKEFSHQTNIVMGQGSFGIGVKGIDSEKNIDVWVNKDDKIYWESFNKCQIFYPLKASEEYSGWPRFFYYTGNDTGFIEWSQKRFIEDFTWKPQKEMNVEFSDSHINYLSIHTNYKLNLIFGDYIKYLDLYGDPNNFIIKKCKKVPSLSFYIKKDDTKEKYTIPNYESLKDAEELLIEVEPNGPSFDCRSILQFPNLKLLHLIGNVTNLSVLKELKHLDKLGFWNTPDLTDLPKLDSWKELTKFVAVNIDENVGKRLKKEIKLLKKSKQYEFLMVSKLRNKLWFETEYGLPFSNWESQKEKKAMNIYGKCLKKIKLSKSDNDIKNVILEYTNSFNKMSDIETIEREDIYNALISIMKNSPIDIKWDKWTNWFDETRDF